ncbi:Hpt domain-containing protein [Paeniroseomonas aquatica]
MDDLLADFLTETQEGLGALDAALVRLERSPDDVATLSEVFRIVHTIKGTFGFLGLTRMEAVAHAGESVLGRYRDGTLRVTQGDLADPGGTGLHPRDRRRAGGDRCRAGRQRRRPDRLAGCRRLR